MVAVRLHAESLFRQCLDGKRDVIETLMPLALAEVVVSLPVIMFSPNSQLVRQYFPKDTDFASVSDEEVDLVIQKLNMRPRKSLDFKTTF